MEGSWFRNEILRKTTGEIRTFLDELANGTSNYKSLHNLTEQVEHQYHGRFLIELIQNAHDVLFEDESPNDLGRLEIVIDKGEEPFGALYVANDGRPFSDSNFQTLSKFGQSDKDPEKSIGNKGIGFRSVLEITKTPEIYSRKDVGSKTFDGYCFSFRPDVTKLFEIPIQEILRGVDCPRSPLDPKTPLVEWGEEKLRAFRGRCSRLSNGWLLEELKYLSPYLLPIPLNADRSNPRIRDFESRKLATLIRLPFMSEKVRALAVSRLEQLDKSTILFLDRVKCLSLNAGAKEKLVERKKASIDDPEKGYEVNIAAMGEEKGDFESKRYWIWEKVIGGEENPEEAEMIRDAVSDLPGKWPELRKAKVALAVRLGSIPEKGNINIYLPTEISSGCAAHINGPFYGDISRTHISFDRPFNQILLKNVAKEAVDVVLNSLAGKGLDEAGAIIDILSPFSRPAELGSRWWSLIQEELSERNLKIEELDIILADDGWNCLKKTSLLPIRNEPKIITDEELRSEACFSVFSKGLSSRKEQIVQLFQAVEIGEFPSDDDLAASVEKVAGKLHSNKDGVDWNDVWHDIIGLFPNNPESLRGRAILLGTDNQLHASSGKSSVFFRPRAGGTDDEILTEGAIDDIPENLRSVISFLHETIRVHVPRPEGGIQVTPIQKYLSSTLVQPFGVEQILRNVLIPATPALPMPLGSAKEGLCRDIIQWGLRLVANLVARDKGEKTVQYLGRLSAPCQGGWYPLSEASFGPGWEGAVGEHLQTYLAGVDTKESKERMKRLLLPPHHNLWGENRGHLRDLMLQAGAFDGLRLTQADPGDWDAKFCIAGWGKVQLPEKAPSCFNDSMWKEYRTFVADHLKPYFRSPFLYEIQPFFFLPGLERFEELDRQVKKALMQVLLASLPKWKNGWEDIQIKKIEGQSHYYTCKSPLHFSLRQIPWLISTNDENVVNFRPRERWYIHSQRLAGNFHQYAHLTPFPGELAFTFDQNPELVASLEDLGMPKYDPEKPSKSSRLLSDLAAALEDQQIEISDMNVFLGQVRTAWSVFYPDESSTFPDRIIVQTNGRTLSVTTPSEDNPAYLPDSTSTYIEGLELHSKPIVPIEFKDARRLSELFKKAYGNGMQLASDLGIKPLVDGQPWEGGSGDLLSSSELKWLMPVLLAVFAFSGGQARGTQTKTFLKAIGNLRGAEICWVNSLEAGIWRGEECIARTPIDAIWLSRAKTLLSTQENREKFSRLSEAFGALMDRSDLDIALKHVLEKLERGKGPYREEIVEALRSLNITQSRFAEVEKMWLGDLSWTIRLLRPLISKFNPKVNLGPLTEATSDAEVFSFLQNQDLGPLDARQALNMVRMSDGLENLGRTLFESVGAEAPLDRWNEVLSQLGEKTIRNENAIEEFQEQLSAAGVPLRAILRRLLRGNSELGKFANLADEIDSLQCPHQFGEKYWVVEFNSVMQEVKLLFKRWGANSEELDAINNGQSVEDLIGRLDRLGLEASVDPVQIYAQNRKRCMEILLKIQQAALIWCLRNGLQVGEWEENPEELMTGINDPLEKDGFLDLWSEKKCFSALKSFPREEMHKNFWDEFDSSSNLNELFKALGISPDELETAKDTLKQYNEKATRLKRMIPVCGKDFECSLENFGQLWGHIVGEVEEKTLPEISLEELSGLGDMSSRKKQPEKTSGGKKRSLKPKSRKSQSVIELIGLAGEIHAYRILLKNYGPGLINPSAWVSENSLRIFPNNKVNDSLGYDFEVRNKGRTYNIEIKATEEEDESFEMGATEIRRAVEIANKKKIKYIILHITKTLSKKPELRFLPNPYDKKYQSSYQIEEAGLRIRYRLSN